MRVITVQASLREDDIAQFLAASVANGRAAVATEPGCSRFDIFHDAADPGRIGFNEVYDNDDAVAAHGESEHFAKWLSDTEGMAHREMVWATCRNLFPGDTARWSAERDGVGELASAGGIRVYQARISVPSDPSDDVDRFIASVTKQARTALEHEGGLLRFDINQNLDVPTELWLYKTHADPAAARDHAAAPYTVAHLERFGDLYSAGPSTPISGPNIWPPDNWTWSSRRVLTRDQLGTSSGRGPHLEQWPAG